VKNHTNKVLKATELRTGLYLRRHKGKCLLVARFLTFIHVGLSYYILVWCWL